MAKELNFIRNSQGKYEVTFTSSGDRMGIEVNRTASGPLVVYGSIDDLKRKPVIDFGPNASEDLLFEIDFPADVKITIISFTEVEVAKVTGS